MAAKSSIIEREHAGSRIAALITPNCPNMARHAILLEGVRDITQVWTCQTVLQLAEAESWVCMTAWDTGLHGVFGEKGVCFFTLSFLYFLLGIPCCQVMYDCGVVIALLLECREHWVAIIN